MTKTRFDSDAGRSEVGNAVTSDGVLLLATLAFGLAMLVTLDVLGLAGVVGIGRVLPFFALPPALLIASGVLLWRWTSSQREEVGVRQVVRSPSAGSSI
jgi:hypothetical protein